MAKLKEENPTAAAQPKTLCTIAETNLFTVWMYRCDAIRDLKRDMEETLEKCIPVTKEMLKTSLLQRFICAVVRIFAPML